MIVGLGEALAVIVMRALNAAVSGIFLLLFHLARRSSPRAEYLADAEAARLASPTAVVSCLDKLLLAKPARLYVEAATRRGEVDIWAPLIDGIAALPPKEHERLRRLAQRSGHRIDETHPPTTLRMELVAALPPIAPLLAVTESDSQAIEQEIALLKPGLAAEVSSHE